MKRESDYEAMAFVYAILGILFAAVVALNCMGWL